MGSLTENWVFEEFAKSLRTTKYAFSIVWPTVQDVVVCFFTSNYWRIDTCSERHCKVGKLVHVFLVRKRI